MPAPIQLKAGIRSQNHQIWPAGANSRAANEASTMPRPEKKICIAPSMVGGFLSSRRLSLKRPLCPGAFQRRPYWAIGPSALVRPGSHRYRRSGSISGFLQSERRSLDNTSVVPPGDHTPSNTTKLLQPFEHIVTPSPQIEKELKSYLQLDGTSSPNSRICSTPNGASSTSKSR